MEIIPIFTFVLLIAGLMLCSFLGAAGMKLPID